MDNREVICYCAGVTKAQSLEALDNGARNLDDIKQMTGACTIGRCKEISPTGKGCSSAIIGIIREYNNIFSIQSNHIYQS